MAAKPTRSRLGAGPSAPAELSAPLGARIARQVHGIDAWLASVRLRTSVLAPGSSAAGAAPDAARRSEVLRRTTAAMAAMTARELARAPGPLRLAVPTAVVAHSHEWFADTVCALLASHGFDVVERTDDAAQALGAVIAEQPDLVLVGARLAAMTGAELLAETALFSPLSVRIAQADEEQAPALAAAGAAAVMPRHLPPADVADDAARLVAVTRLAGARS